MEKSLGKKVEQINNIIQGGKGSLLLIKVKNSIFSTLGNKIESVNKLGKKLVKLEETNPYLTKEEKLRLLERKEYRTIKNSTDNLQSYKDNREIIEQEKDKIDLFYKKYNIDKKYLRNAKNYIISTLKQKEIKNKEFHNIMQCINGDRFIIANDIDGESASLEIKKINNEINKLIKKHYPQNKNREKGEWIINRGIGKGIDIKNIDKSILKAKKYVFNKIPEYKNIPFIYSESRLRNKDLINLLKENSRKRNKESNIVNTFEQEINSYAKYLGESTDNKRNWKKYVEKGSNLENLILEYEEKNGPLKDGILLIDIEKMKKYFNQN